MAERKKDQSKEDSEVKTITVPFVLGRIKENITITTNSFSQLSKEEILKQASQYHTQGNIQQAVKYYQYFIDQGFIDHRVFNNYGSLLRSIGKSKEAESLLFKAIEIKTDYASAYLNLGTVMQDLGRLEEAELLTRKAIKINPNYLNAHLNLGVILRDKGQLIDAEISTRKALELKPDSAEAYSTLGAIFLQRGRYEPSLKSLLVSADLLRGEKNKEFTHRKFITISHAKIKHDIEQLEYLISQGSKTKKLTDLVDCYKYVASKIDWPSYTKLISLSNEYQRFLNYNYNRIIHIVEAPVLKDGAVNKALDSKKITTDYFNHEFGLTYIDNFLSSKALQSLRKFMLGSTIWFDVKPNGYLGAYLNEGLANPLILQIAKELRLKFPKIFKDYPITQIWAFKYDSRTKNESSSPKGINVHADFAAVNVNFWITPIEANLNKNSGGLIVYDVEAPKDWDFNSFNNNENKIRDELKKGKGNTSVIPYNENRAVVFNSNLFHETDSYEFKEGYENRRINITILFGSRN